MERSLMRQNEILLVEYNSSTCKNCQMFMQCNDWVHSDQTLNVDENVFTFGRTKLQMEVKENVIIFLSVCEHVSCYGVNCIFCCRSSIRFDISNVSFNFSNFSSLILHFFLHVIQPGLPPTPRGQCACIWMGKKFLFFPLGLLGFRIMWRHTKCFQHER